MEGTFHVPVIPFMEGEDKVGNPPAPAQMVKPPPHEKVGVILGVTVTVKLAGNAHNPAVGVKV